jgi:LacI family transcriptional regulator
MMFGREAPVIEELASHALPLVVMDGAPAFPRMDAVRVNYDEGIRQAVAHLVELGHKTIAFVSGPLEQASARLRRAAFEKAMRAQHLKAQPDLMLEGDHTLEGGMAAMTKLLSLSHQPTAVVCSNDLTAIGVLHRLFEVGKQAPADLSVIGFDDVHIAQFMLPPLTTVRMSCADIAKVAFSTLRHRIEPVSTHYTPPLVETKLILRQTTGAPPSGDLKTSHFANSNARSRSRKLTAGTR